MSRRPRHPHSGPATYELTVVGALGPVLRHAIAPHATTVSEHQTVIFTELGEDADLVDLVLMLASRGLEIADVVDRG